MFQITFLPQQKKTEVSRGTTLLQAAAAAGVEITADCGGKGTCGKCKVKVISGPAVSEASPAEKEHLAPAELAAGWVLACQQKVTGPMVLQLQLQVSKEIHLRKTSLESIGPEVPVEPSVEKVLADMGPPTVRDQRADAERLRQSLGMEDLQVSRKALVNLPRLMRKNDFLVTAVLAGKDLLAVEPGNTTGRKFGLAVDIGTTTVMASLMDLQNGELLAAASATNKQQVFGADVIARITHASTRENGLNELQQRVVQTINEVVEQLLQKTGAAEKEIYEAVVVGNTTMSHLFLGIDPSYLAPAPFVPAFSRMLEVEAGELGLRMHPWGRVVVLPNIAGYVGSDTLGVLLATRLQERKGNCLAVDIGTNGELMLAREGRVLTCSTAAGPAFEGAQIKSGMRAAEGAVETVRIEDDVFLEVIGDTAPVGICGSAIIDAVAEMLKAGIIDKRGSFIKEEEHKTLPPLLQRRLRRGSQSWEFMLVEGSASATGEDIVFSQKDIRELQLAKGAIAAGTSILLKEMKLKAEELDEILLAGAFGNYIKKESALAVGLLPAVEPKRIISAGNAAGDGARMALISQTERVRARELALRVEHVELSGRSDFHEEFMGALHFSQA